MTNQYKPYLDSFFSELLELRHSTNRLEKVLKKDVEIYTEKGAQFHSGSALIISDWTGITDNGWDLNFHTGIFKETTKESYEREINQILSRECCLMYAQSFEFLEKYIKNCLFNLQMRDNELKNYIINLQGKNKPQVTREQFLGGEKLFKTLKKAGGLTFQKYSKQNNKNIEFKELWTILSETRHSITHSSSIIRKDKLNKSEHHLNIFNFLFNSSKFDNDNLLLELDYKKLDRLIKKLSEFAFQILKILSKEENTEWDVYK